MMEILFFVRSLSMLQLFYYSKTVKLMCSGVGNCFSGQSVSSFSNDVLLSR